MKLLQLTGPDGAPIWVNPSDVSWFQQVGLYTEVELTGRSDGRHLVVQETPVTVAAMWEKALGS